MRMYARDFQLAPEATGLACARKPSYNGCEQRVKPHRCLRSPFSFASVPDLQLPALHLPSFDALAKICLQSPILHFRQPHRMPRDVTKIVPSTGSPNAKLALHLALNSVLCIPMKVMTANLREVRARAGEQVVCL